MKKWEVARLVLVLLGTILTIMFILAVRRGHADVILPGFIVGETKLPDPWGQVGQDVSIRAVDVGGLECAVLVQRDGSERRTALWCRAR